MQKESCGSSLRKTGRHYRDLLSVAILISVILYGVISPQTNVLFRWKLPAQNEEILECVQRFEPLREALPPSGVIGYITGRSREQRLIERIPRFTGKPHRIWPTDHGAEVAWREYFLAQYALAPNVLHVGEGFPLVVGNFSEKELRKGDKYRIGLQLVRDFGDGVLLFRDGR